MNKQTFAQRIKGVIISPSKTFEEIVENGASNQVLMIVLVGAFLSTLIYGPKTGLSGIFGWFVGSGILWIVGTKLFKGVSKVIFAKSFPKQKAFFIVIVCVASL